MKTNLLWTSVAIMALAGCRGGDGGKTEAGIVDVETAISAPRQLKLSDLGSDVRFVRLETSDSSLIGGDWKAVFFGDRILVGNTRSIMTEGENFGRAMVFDLGTGKFLHFVGSQGQGPGEYLFPNPLGVNPSNGDVYFTGSNLCGWAVYNIDGTSKGTFLSEAVTGSNALTLAAVTARGPLMRKRVDGSTRSVALYSYSPEGELLDSTVILDKPGSDRTLPGFNAHSKFYSHDTALGEDIIEVVCQDKHYILGMGGLFNAVGSDLHYHEYMCDTVFDVADGGKPTLIFNLGPNFKPIEKIGEEWFSSSDLIVTDVLETPSKAIFGISKGWFSDDTHSEWIGVYDRDTRTTVMGAADDAFADDLSDFMPVVPSQTLPDGTIVGWLTMEQIADWLDEHPDAPRPEWLGDFDIEDNPVLVLIK